MKAFELYLSMLEKSKVKTYVNNEVTPDINFDFNIKTDEFTISNKQGFFMQKLINEEKINPVDSFVINQTKNEEIRLIYPPNYIKTNGFFTIRKTTIKRINKINN